jgi:hypothetical protein
MIIIKPAIDTLSSYYQSYLKYVSEKDLLAALSNQKNSTQEFLKSIHMDKASFAYAAGKWMLKEVIGHLCDTERILTYRALRFSRNDQTALPGFDENTFAANSNYRNRDLPDIAKEYEAIRQSSVLLFSNMENEMFDRKGKANQSEATVRGLLFFIIAHERHHLKVIQEKYLS